MDTNSELLSHPYNPRTQARVVALKYDHRLAHPRQRAMRLTMVWLSFCVTFVISLGAALSLAG